MPPNTLPPIPPDRITTVFGTHNGPHGALDSSGVLSHLHIPPTSPHQVVPHPRSAGDSPRIAHLALTSAAKLALVFLASPAANLTHLLEFPSLATFEAWFRDPSGTAPQTTSSPSAAPSSTHHMVPGRSAQLAASATGFVLLQQDGSVYTWGDARYHASLGRVVSAAAPAERPGLLEALAGVPVGKVVAGGWLSAALSRDGDVYVWGMRGPGGEDVPEVLVAGEGEEARLVEVDGEGDVKDVGVGAGHVVVVAGEGRVFAVGENGNGQLGLGESAPGFVKEWREVEELRGKNVVRVVCGAKTSFALVRA